MNEEARKRLEMIKSAGRKMDLHAVPVLRDAPAEIELDDGSVFVLDEMATLKCDGCGREAQLPAELMPEMLPAVVLCSECVTS